MDTMMTKIETVKQLIGECLGADDSISCFVHFGFARSSKTISYDLEADVFEVHNEIDDSFEILTRKGLFSKSIIGEAIEKGCFYKY